jgi:hypothetical protein
VYDDDDGVDDDDDDDDDDDVDSSLADHLTICLDSS